MPLVQRPVVHEVSTTFSKIKGTITKYVSPTRVRPTDRAVEPTDKQLAELAALSPKEFGQKAKDRGVTPVDLDALRAQASDDDDLDLDLDLDLDTDAEGDTLDEAQRLFLEMSATDAVASLRENKTRKAFLAKLYAAETAQPSPRASVLKVFKSFGFSPE